MTRPALGLAIVALAIPAVVSAQPLGTFRWQLLPHCNVITVTVVQEGGQYHLNGTDDQCGASQRASVVGLAFGNPDGSIGFGLTTVTTPGGAPVHIDARITLAALGGTWTDSAGNSGTFSFTPGAGSGGSPRPQPVTAVPSAIQLRADGGLLAGGQLDIGAIPASGAGTRTMWHPRKASFRAGFVNGAQWDDAATGFFSAALGRNTRALNFADMAFGNETTASGGYSTAMGSLTTASGLYSTALGTLSMAIGAASTAMGGGSRAIGVRSTAMGHDTVASGEAATAIGGSTTASGNYSLATGYGTSAGPFSFAGGFQTSAAGDMAFAFGHEASASGVGSVVLGRMARTTANAAGSFMFADRSTTAPFESIAPNEFGARFAGGFYLYTRADLGTGVAVAPSGSSWAALSDVNAKENFRDVSGEEVLRKLALIPIREWNYKAQDHSIRHMGPTAQDFNAAFGLGDFPLRINTIDADGIALAAINALERRTRDLPQRAADVDRLAADNASLRAQLEAARVDLAEVREQLADLTRQVLGRK